MRGCKVGALEFILGLSWVCRGLSAVSIVGNGQSVSGGIEIESGLPNIELAGEMLVLCFTFPVPPLPRRVW